MKKMINTFIMIIGLMICVNVCAKTNYSDTPSFTNNYIKKFNNYQRYIVTEPVNYGFKNGNITSNGKFKTGGLLNVDEFNLSFRNGSSYLFNGLEYFTMTENESNIAVIDPRSINYISYKNNTSENGIRVTNYVQNNTRVNGSGTKIDPWTFKDKVRIRYEYNEKYITISPSTKTVNYNDAVVSNVSLTKGYEYDTNTCGAVYTNGRLTLSNIYNDIVCRINTKPCRYTVTFDRNCPTNGSGGPTTVTATFENEMPPISDTPICPGMTFSGWEDSDGVLYYNSSNVSQRNYDVASETTLYGKWTPNEYTITYYLGNGNSNEGQHSIGTTTCTFGQSCTLRAFSSLGATFPLSANGWEFAGWSATRAGTNRDYTNTQQFTYNTVGNMNLYAVGKRTFNFYSGIAPTSKLSSDIQYWNPYQMSTVYSTSIAVPNVISINGWSFVGYCSSDEASSTVLLDSSSQGSTYNPYANYLTDLDFRSIYSRDITLSYNSNGGSGTMSNQTTKQYYNTGIPVNGVNNTAKVSEPSFTLSNNSFTKIGHTFSKWAEGSANGTEYSAGSTYNSFKPGVSESNTTITMYAKWTAITYTVTFDKRDGNGGTDSVDIEYGTTVGNYPSITKPTKSGHSFAGYWTMNNDNYVKQYYNENGNSVTTWDIASNTTLYAKWTANTYTVTFDKRDGNGGTNSVDIEYGTTVGNYPAITKPTKSGHSFAGYWTMNNGNYVKQYYNENANSVTTWDIASNTTLYAKWTACSAGTYSNNNKCSACPIADSGWTATSPEKSSSVTACYETQTPANCSSGTVMRTAKSDGSGYNTSITLVSALKANANYYTTTTATSCTACSTLGNGYTTSDANTNSGSGACYLTTTAGKFVKTSKAAQETCTAGGGCPGSVKINYGSTGGRNECSKTQYQANTGQTSCNDCEDGYSHTSTGSTSASNCKITCTANYAVKTANAKCTSCGTNYSSSGGTVTQGSVSTGDAACKATYVFAFNYTGNFRVNDDTTVRTGNYNFTSSTWKVYFLTSGKFTPDRNYSIDAFLVGGGGSGAIARGYSGGGGGGGGYTFTRNNISLSANTSYNITIGEGGTKKTGNSMYGTPQGISCDTFRSMSDISSVVMNDNGSKAKGRGGAGEKGGDTKAFNYTAEGGDGGKIPCEYRSGGIGGNGGSGGGAGKHGSGAQITDGVHAGNGGTNGQDGNVSENYGTLCKYGYEPQQRTRETIQGSYCGWYGAGQGTNTCEFDETNSNGSCKSGNPYGAGGGGGAAWVSIFSNLFTFYGGSGGSYGGGSGYNILYKPDTNGHSAPCTHADANGESSNSGLANTGGGGGGASGLCNINHNSTSGAGGSGIVVIRNKR